MTTLPHAPETFLNDVLGKFLASRGRKQRANKAPTQAQESPICRQTSLSSSCRFLLWGSSHAGGRWFDPSRAHSHPRSHASLAQPRHATDAIGAIGALRCPPRCPP